MSTKEKEIVKVEIAEMIQYSVTDKAIAEMKEEYLSLEVKDFGDKKGYMACYEARQAVKKKRCDVEKKRK